MPAASPGEQAIAELDENIGNLRVPVKDSQHGSARFCGQKRSPAAISGDKNAAR
jgi:hypothetical protein